ncbi:MAG: FlgO family outer membrane protein [Hyphomicrobiaceae bacterium]
MRHRFDQFELDSEQFVLRANGSQVHIEPLVFDLLRFFVRNAGKVVTRDEIIGDVWNGRAVSDATVSSCIKSVRKALGDDGQRQHYVRTVRGRGFQFVACVTIEKETPARTNVEVSPVAPEEVQCDDVAVELAHSSPPRIAVLPLFPLSRDPEQELLGDALSQEVILELSRLHWLFVIARGSSFKVRGQAIDLEEAGRRLGATYLLTGTIAKHDDAYVIAVELCHAPDSNVVWAERFTSPAADLMHMRAALAVEIAGALEPRIQLAEAMQARRVPTEQLDAWAAYHRGLWHMYRFNRRDNELAADMFAQSIQLDPRFARAHAGL